MPAHDRPSPSGSLGSVADSRRGGCRRPLRGWLAELGRFGSVGVVGFVVDIALFNLLLLGPGALLGDHPVAAKAASASVGTLVAWVGSRYWAFSGSRRSSRRRELGLFSAVNLGGMLIAVGTLALSHHVLGFTSALADNIAANVVGGGLATVFRYIFYRNVVFTGRR